MSADSTTEAEHSATIDVLLAAAGVAVPEGERARLARLYPGLRASVDRFHDVDVGDGVQTGIHRPGEYRIVGESELADGVGSDR